MPRSRRGPLPRPGGHRGRQDAQPRGGERAGARGGPLVLPPRPGQALAQLRRIRLAQDRDQVRADLSILGTPCRYDIYSWGKLQQMFTMLAVQTAICLCDGCIAMLIVPCKLYHDISTFYLLFLPTLYIYMISIYLLDVSGTGTSGRHGGAPAARQPATSAGPRASIGEKSH